MKVKPLKFVFSDDEDGAYAETPFCRYEIFTGRSGSWCAELKFGQQCIILSRVKNISKEQSQRICQQDFNEKIMLCLEINKS